MSSHARKKIIVPDAILNCLLKYHCAQGDSHTFGPKFRVEPFLQEKLCASIPETHLACDGFPVQVQKVKSQPALGKEEPAEAIVKTPLCRVTKNSFSAFG